MATSDFLPFATAVGANVVDQGTYAAASYVGAGRGSGVLPSNVYNKIARQGNFMAAVLAKLITTQTGSNCLDDGDLDGKVALLVSAFNAIAATNFTTGDIKLTLKTTADSGWVMCNDGTIGDASSGASARANADCQQLFLLLWNNVDNAYAAVSGGGRGVSAAADWAAHKTIALTKTLGRALAIAGSGSGLTARALGATAGAEAVALSIAQMPAHNHGGVSLSVADHTHPYKDWYYPEDSAVLGLPGPTLVESTGGINANFGSEGTDADNTSVLYRNATTTAAGGHNHSIASDGNGAAHDNIQPTSFLNAMIKL